MAEKKKAEPKSTAEMKSLANLSPNPGSHRQRKRLGRGTGSGLGKTAGKGHKGQRARKSGNIRPGFEGGQMKLYMRLPKRGFHNMFRVDYNVVNLDTLSKFFESGETVSPESLTAKGLVRFANKPIKLLARGALNKKLDVSLHNASTTAKAAIEKAGGRLTILDQR